MLNDYAKLYDEKIIAINLSLSDSISKVINYVTNGNYRYSFIMDIDGAISSPYGIEYIPYVVVLDSKGIISYKGSAPRSTENLKTLFESIK